MDSPHDSVDLDELVEDEDDGNLIISGRLDSPISTQYTTQQLHSLIHEGQIDLNPEYQREVVWTAPKQSKLLDSLFRNFYVPPVVFAVSLDSDGDEVKVCVDGKQRLTSILKFIDGQLPYKDPLTGRSYYFTTGSGKNRLQLPEIWKKDFANKPITCVEYRNLPQGLERDIFQRVQMGMPLLNAEKLQAIASPWSNFIMQLDRKWVSPETGLTDKIDLLVERGRSFQIVAQLVYCCDGIPSQLIPSAGQLERFLARTEGEPREEFSKAMDSVLRTFWNLANNTNLNKFVSINKRVAPAEFVFIGVLLYVMRYQGEDAQAEEVYHMRQRVRSKFADVRMNNNVVKFLWDIITEVSERLDTGVHLEGGASGRVTRATTAKGLSKRKKDKVESEGEGNYKPKSTKPKISRG